MGSDVKVDQTLGDSGERRAETPSPPGRAESSPADDVSQSRLRLASPDDGTTLTRDGASSLASQGTDGSRQHKESEGHVKREPSDHAEGLDHHDHHGTGTSNPASDEDPSVVDEKRQKRMLSNRESARRSRLKKQHHLDEMKQQVSQLRAENTDMVTKYNIASRHYAQITDENRSLRSHAMDLSRRLQRLHHAATSQGMTMGHEYMGLSHLDPSMQLSFTLSPASAMQHPSMAHHVPGPAFPYSFPSSVSPEMTR